MSEMTIYDLDKEASAAAEWWARSIAAENPRKDNGDALQSALMSFVSRGRPALSDQQIAAFREALKGEIVASIVSRGCPWDETDPFRGSMLRTVDIDYGLYDEHPVAKAAAAAGIADIELRVPIKTCMWIDPGRVTVASGYGAAPEEIYPAPAPRREEAP